MTPVAARRILGVTTSAAVFIGALSSHVTKWQGVAVAALVAAVMICDRHGWLWYGEDVK